VNTVYFLNCTFTGSAASGAFIELGDWSDYDKEPQPPTRNVHLDASNAFDCPTIPVRRGNSRRHRESQTIRPLRTYYVADIHAQHHSERLPPPLIPVYFGIQDIFK